MRRRIKDSIQKITIKGKSRHDPAGIDNTARAASSSTSRGNTTVAFPVGPSTWVECEDADVDICFVHGLTGNRDTTWTAKGEIEPWPKTLLPTEFPNCRARIMTYGYDAYIVRWGAASSNQLIDHAITFLQKISADREKARGTARPLIIVAHSLGGLVTKQAILQSKNSPEPHLQNLFKMTKGIIFMGTPHAGSWMADWFKIPIDIFGILKSNNTSLLRVLQTNDELLRSLNKDFLSLLRVLREGDGQKIHVTCFYEELGYPKVGHIVSRSSATFASDTPISIHANHSEMVKFRSVSDDGFQSVAGELRRWMEDFRCSASPVVEPAFSILELVGLPDTERSRTAISACLMILNLQDTVDKLQSPKTGEKELQTKERETERDRERKEEEEKERTKERDKLKGNLERIVSEAVSRCRRSLVFDDMMAREEIIGRPESETCQWIYQNENYLKWFNDRRSLLWIKGKPGSGKSTLMKSLLKQREEVLKDSGVILLRFFFNARGSEIERSSEALYKTLLHSLIQLDQVTLYEVLATYLKKETQNRVTRWHSIELAELFHDKIEQPGMGDIEILIDALDECSDTEVLGIVRRFERSVQLNPQGTLLKICWSSRFYPHIGFTIAQGVDLIVNENNEQDIKTYVAKIFQPTVYKCIQSVVDEIISRANGIFLWAYLVADRLLRAFNAGKTASQLSTILRRIPDSLENLFLEIFDETHFTAEQRQDLRRIAVVVFGALRPVSLGELHAALMLSDPSGLSCLNDTILTDENVEQFKRRVNHASGGLMETVKAIQDTSRDAAVTLNQSFFHLPTSPEIQSRPDDLSTFRVQVIHESVREFFLGRGLSILQAFSRKTFEQTCHLELARASIEGLSRLEIDLSTTRICTDGKPAAYDNEFLAGLIPQMTWHPPPPAFIFEYVVDHFFTHLDSVCHADDHDGHSRPDLPSSATCREALYAYVRIACHEATHDTIPRRSVEEQLRIGRCHANVFEMSDKTLANYLAFPARLKLTSNFLLRRDILLSEDVDEAAVVGEADDMEKVIAIFTISHDDDTELSYDCLSLSTVQNSTYGLNSAESTTEDAYMPCISRNVSEVHQSAHMSHSSLLDISRSFDFVLGVSFSLSATSVAHILLPDRLLDWQVEISNRKKQKSPETIRKWRFISTIDSELLRSTQYHLVESSEPLEPKAMVCHLFHYSVDFSEDRGRIGWILTRRSTLGKDESDALTLWRASPAASEVSICSSASDRSALHARISCEVCFEDEVSHCIHESILEGDLEATGAWIPESPERLGLEF